MQATASSTRILRPVLLVIAIGGAVAVAFACAAWQLLPYESLDAETAAQRFRSGRG